MGVQYVKAKNIKKFRKINNQTIADHIIYASTKELKFEDIELVNFSSTNRIIR